MREQPFTGAERRAIKRRTLNARDCCEELTHGKASWMDIQALLLLAIQETSWVADKLMLTTRRALGMEAEREFLSHLLYTLWEAHRKQHRALAASSCRNDEALAEVREQAAEGFELLDEAFVMLCDMWPARFDGDKAVA